jgi:toxin-antitoxin system PIN domain toxin
VILPDVNVLLAAYRSDAAAYTRARNWLDAVVRNRIRFALASSVLASVVRITSNRQIFDPPSSTEDAIGFCDDLISQPNAAVIQPGPEHWSIFSKLCIEAKATGNLITDAWIAALAIEWGCELITFDRDFSLFKGLRHREPD